MAETSLYKDNANFRIFNLNKEVSHFNAVKA